jgi:hypothetical protein
VVVAYSGILYLHLYEGTEKNYEQKLGHNNIWLELNLNQVSLT